jgi:hypothetical protein
MTCDLVREGLIAILPIEIADQPGMLSAIRTGSAAIGKYRESPSTARIFRPAGHTFRRQSALRSRTASRAGEITVLLDLTDHRTRRLSGHSAEG